MTVDKPRAARRILFVCLGNICRSPAAEGIFRHLSQAEGLEEQFECDSAGVLDAQIGNPPDARMIEAARRRGYTLTGRARQIEPADLRRFDLIVTMDDLTRDLCRSLAESDALKTKVVKLTRFHPAGETEDVPDPYMRSWEAFERALDVLEPACRGLLAAVVGPLSNNCSDPT